MKNLDIISLVVYLLNKIQTALINIVQIILSFLIIIKFNVAMCMNLIEEQSIRNCTLFIVVEKELRNACVCFF